MRLPSKAKVSQVCGRASGGRPFVMHRDSASGPRWFRQFAAQYETLKLWGDTPISLCVHVLRKSVEPKAEGRFRESGARRGSATTTQTFKRRIMKRKYASVLLVLIGLLGTCSATKAGQGREQIKVTLPFEFVVDGKTLPAGTYTAIRFADDKSTGLILSNRESRVSVIVHPVEVEGASADRPELTFQRVGEQIFLSGIRTSHDVYEVAVPRSAVLEATRKSDYGTSGSESSGNN